MRPEIVAAQFERKPTSSFVGARHNLRQQPGEFLADIDGILRLTYRYQYCEDFPDREVIRRGIRSL